MQLMLVHLFPVDLQTNEKEKTSCMYVRLFVLVWWSMQVKTIVLNIIHTNESQVYERQSILKYLCENDGICNIGYINQVIPIWYWFIVDICCCCGWWWWLWLYVSILTKVVILFFSQTRVHPFHLVLTLLCRNIYSLLLLWCSPYSPCCLLCVGWWLVAQFRTYIYHTNKTSYFYYDL
jgi:hypothetical protein